MIAADKLGKVTVAAGLSPAATCTPAASARRQPSDPPAGSELGPVARPAARCGRIQDNIAPYKFRWWDLYSSQMANQGVHFLDMIRWMTGDLAPASICAMGGRFAVDDDRTIPDTMEAAFECPSGRLVIFGQYEASGNPALARERATCELRGTQGTVYVSRADDRDVDSRDAAASSRTTRRAWRPSDQARTGDSGGTRRTLDRPPSTPGTSSTACVRAQHAQRRRGDRPPLDHLQPAGQHLAGHPKPAANGTPSSEQITNNDAANEPAALRVPQAVEAGLTSGRHGDVERRQTFFAVRGVFSNRS